MKFIKKIKERHIEIMLFSIVVICVCAAIGAWFWVAYSTANALSQTFSKMPM